MIPSNILVRWIIPDTKNVPKKLPITIIGNKKLVILYDKIINIVRKYQYKFILFGSRARGTHTERSDIDIAVSGGNFEKFYWQVMDKVHSLLTFDIVELDKGISKELQDEIDNEGIVIYEKTR